MIRVTKQQVNRVELIILFDAYIDLGPCLDSSCGLSSDRAITGTVPCRPPGAFLELYEAFLSQLEVPSVLVRGTWTCLACPSAFRRASWPHLAAPEVPESLKTNGFCVFLQ